LKRQSIEYNFILEGEGWRYRGTHWNLPLLPAPALAGDIQFSNAATALAALEELGAGMKITAQAVAHGLTQVQLTGRFQVLKSGPQAPTWILDVAHNQDAARVLARNLSATAGNGKTYAIAGILADKDAAAIAEALRDCFDGWWCSSIEGARGQSGAALAEIIATQVTAPVTAAVTVESACAAARGVASPADRIVVFGSFHTVGPALDWLEAQGFVPPTRQPEYTSAPRNT
jgi:dihydrofolate synthase / folylpolyglutamate synthase